MYEFIIRQKYEIVKVLSRNLLSCNWAYSKIFHKKGMIRKYAINVYLVQQYLSTGKSGSEVYQSYEGGNKVELSKYMKSIIDMDRSSVVICNLDHKIIYMNPAAVRRYEKRGGEDLIGKSLMSCHNEKSRAVIEKVTAWFAESADNNMIYTYYNEKENKDVYMVALRDEDNTLIGYYEKHEYRDRETAGLYDFSRSLV